MMNRHMTLPILALRCEGCVFFLLHVDGLQKYRLYDANVH